jgi:sialic acid synthase
MSFEITYKDRKQFIGRHVFTIAEIGSTHCASLTQAKLLIDVAKIAKVDCVKFQKRDVESLLTKKEKERKYDSINAMAPTYGEHRKIMEFSEKEFVELRDYAASKDLFFTASGWDVKSVDFLDSLGVPFIKVASADLTNLPLLRHIARKKRPVFLSTGMASMFDVKMACEVISEYEKRIVLMQCTSSYPAPYDQLDLNVLKTFKQSFPNVVLGYSGHELGTFIPCVAVSLGAKVIEKHFTLNKSAIGSDHKTALNPSELGELVENIKNTEKALGHSEKKIQPSEIPCIRKLCKSVTTTCAIKKGEFIKGSMITTKSPCVGIPANLYYDIIGKEVYRDIPADTTIVEADLFPEKSS